MQNEVVPPGKNNVEDAPRHKEEELSKDQEEENNEFKTTSLDPQTEIPSWLEQQLKSKSHVLLDPKAHLEAILAQAQVKTREKKKPKVKSHITTYTSSSQILQITTPPANKDARTLQSKDYQVTTINLGLASRAQKVDDFQGSITTIL